MNEDSERKAFEEWAATWLGEFSLELNNAGHYRAIDTRLTWLAWQARAKGIAAATPVAWYSTVKTPAGTTLQRLGFTREEAEMANAEPIPLYAHPTPAAVGIRALAERDKGER